ncbi:MAG: large conductance mechanosensitive channel protein MscL [Geminicoccaceae bacterium]|jgi:large conductance mechanosensitive channel
MLNEFKEFILRGNAMDMAVGIIMGAAFGAMVGSLVEDVIMPPIGWMLGGVDFSTIFFSLTGEDYATLDAAKEAGAPVLGIGAFINALIKLIVVGFAVFMLVKAVNKMNRAKEEEPAPEEPAADVALLTEIRDLLKK